MNSKSKKRKVSSRKRKKVKEVIARPVRRSRRQQKRVSYNESTMEKIIGDTELQSSTGVSNNNFLQYSPMEPVDKVHQEDDLPFDVSNVFAYSCCDESESTTSDAKSSLRKLTLASSESFGPRTTLKRLKSVGTNDRYFSDPRLKKIYSITFQQTEQPDVFVAGGHGGQVAAFGIHDILQDCHGAEGDDGNVYSDFIEPLMSYKAHSGWISTVQFITSVNLGKHVLMTASNDAVVTLWDMTKQLSTDRKKDIRPKILATNKTLHNNGIFSAHEKNGKIVTGSKDKSVVVSKIQDEGQGIVPLHEYCVHTGVVKSAAFRDNNILASGGNDSIIFVYDVRLENGLTTKSNDASHHFAINSISWHPTQDHSLISADFGNTINVWDLRNFTSPVKQLKGHSHIHDYQRGSIYHPCFVANGANILTNGAKTDTLSIFDFDSGLLKSKGTVDIGNVECVGTNNAWGTLIGCSRGNKIQLMKGDFEGPCPSESVMNSF